MHGRGPKLGSFAPLMSFNKFESVIFEKNEPKWPKLAMRAYIFARKNSIKKLLDLNLLNFSRGT